MSTLDAATIKHLLRKGTQIPEDDLASVDGLPEELLQDALRELHYRQDTLRGYRPLDAWFLSFPPDREAHDKKFASGPWHPYYPMFMESGLEGKYTHTLLVADLWMRKRPDSLSWLPLLGAEKNRYPGEHTEGYDARRHGRLRVYLTRKTDSFIVWASWPESKFIENLGIKSVVEAIDELTPDGVRLHEKHSRGQGKGDEEIEVVHPALSIVRGIAISIEESFRLKRKDADLEEKTYCSLVRHSGIAIPSVPV